MLFTPGTNVFDFMIKNTKTGKKFYKSVKKLFEMLKADIPKDYYQTINDYFEVSDEYVNAGEFKLELWLNKLAQ